MDAKQQALYNDLSKALKAKLRFLRPLTGFVITSGKRDISQNTAAGGVPNSSHLTGDAVDLKATTPAEAAKLITLASALGFERVGYNDYKGFVHLDVDTTKPKPALWNYDQAGKFIPALEGSLVVKSYEKGKKWRQAGGIALAGIILGGLIFAGVWASKRFKG